MGSATVYITKAGGDNGGGMMACVQLDCGSTTSFVTKRVVEKCKAELRPAVEAVRVVGIGGAATDCTKVAVLDIWTGYIWTYSVVFRVLENIGKVAAVPYSRMELGIDEEENLADEFPSAADRNIDVLLGNDVLWDMIAVTKQWRRSPKHPGLALIPTRLGTVLMGRIGDKKGALINCMSILKCQVEKRRPGGKKAVCHIQALRNAAGRPAGPTLAAELEGLPAGEAERRSPPAEAPGADHDGGGATPREASHKQGKKAQDACPKAQRPEVAAARHKQGKEAHVAFPNAQQPEAAAARRSKKQKAPTNYEQRLEVELRTEAMVKRFMSIEALGVEPVEETTLKPLQKQALDSFYTSLTFDETRRCYSVGLIFHPEMKTLHSNRAAALMQYQSL